MPRVKRAVHAQKKRRKVLEEAKGYWGLKSTNYKYAKEQVERSLAYAYRDRKVKKRKFRQLWIMRINAGARANGLSYNQFISGLKLAGVELERQADIFRREAEYFDSRSPLYAALACRLAGDERVAAIAPDLRWDLPLRLL